MEVGGNLRTMVGKYYIDGGTGVGTWNGRNICIMNNYVNHDI